MNKKQFEQAVADFVATEAPGLIVTGWVLSLSVKHPDQHDADGYVVEHSDGLPYHSQLGLLHASLNEKTNVVLSQVIKE